MIAANSSAIHSSSSISRSRMSHSADTATLVSDTSITAYPHMPRAARHASMDLLSCWVMVSPLVMSILRGLARSAIGMRSRRTPAV